MIDKLSITSFLTVAAVAALAPGSAAEAQSSGTARAPALVAAVAPAGASGQQEPAYVSPLRPQGGMTQWSGWYGLGINQEINNSADGIHIANAGVRWTYLWSEKGAGVLRGHPGFGIELVPLTAFIEANHTTWAFGANIMYEHHFTGSGRVLPVWRLGAGALYASNPIPEGETKFNFSLLTDFGVDIVLSGTQALYLGYRLHHVSNANIGDVNPGINVHMIVFGLTFYR